jgi:hypothetical protein
MFFSANELKYGSVTATIRIASTTEMRQSNIDSKRNWPTNCIFCPPRVFRIPTSFARFAARAVLKLMKLILAINRTKNAIEANTYTVVRLLFGWIS